jgi:hypothetical protein
MCSVFCCLGVQNILSLLLCLLVAPNFIFFVFAAWSTLIFKDHVCVPSKRTDLQITWSFFLQDTAFQVLCSYFFLYAVTSESSIFVTNFQVFRFCFSKCKKCKLSTLFYPLGINLCNLPCFFLGGGAGTVISITVSFAERSYFEYTRMLSPIYHHVINLVVVLPIRRGPEVFINVSAQEYRALHNSVFLMWLSLLF